MYCGVTVNITGGVLESTLSSTFPVSVQNFSYISGLLLYLSQWLRCFPYILLLLLQSWLSRDPTEKQVTNQTSFEVF
jgi:hypothetical protein